MMLHRILCILTFAALFTAIACDGGNGAGSKQQAAGHEGQGEEISADPQFQITITMPGESGGTITTAGRLLSLFEAKPAKGDERERPQGFELRGENFELVGRLPENLKIAPSRRFEQLVGQPLQIRQSGGDPTNMSMSKIRLGDKVYLGKSGTLTVEKAFHRRGQYAGVSGKFEVELQQIKLGDTEDPDNKGDQPVGDPVKATGTFTVRADSFAFEQL